jgi:RHS repeat-associated protein
MRTTYNGGVEGTYTSLPFGDAQTTAGTDTDPYHYAQLDSDYESGTDHAQFRQYSDAQGRWLSPDPYSGSYDAFNPQSFNRYVYVGNNPLSATDPSGLYRAAPCMGGSQCNNRDSSNPLDPSPTSLWSGAITGTILTVDLDNLVYSPAHWAPDTSQPDVPGASVWVAGAWVDETDTSDFSWYLNSPASTAPFELAQNLAPGANGALQAMKAATRGVPKVDPPPSLAPKPMPPITPAVKSALQVALEVLEDVLTSLGDASLRDFVPPVVIDPCKTPSGFPTCG